MRIEVVANLLQAIAGLDDVIAIWHVVVDSLRCYSTKGRKIYDVSWRNWPVHAGEMPNPVELMT